MASGREKLMLRVLYCDDYLGYTLRSWLEEVRDLLEQEYCVELAVSGEKKCGAGALDPVLLGDGELVLEGLPGEEGYLIEELKRFLEERGAERCHGGG